MALDVSLLVAILHPQALRIRGLRPGKAQHSTLNVRKDDIMRRLTLGMIAGAAMLALGMAAPASAAPLGAATAAAVQPAAANGIEKVHYRRYRHCHGPSWDRWCHGGNKNKNREIKVTGK